MAKSELEENLEFQPRFNEAGLIPCIVTSAINGKVLMFAWMNEEALKLSLETGQAHYWSRSRKALWHKGESSGMTQAIIEMRVDCDQDCLWISVEMPGGEASCHTGRKSCFYRVARKDGTLKFIEDEKLFDPDTIYS